jgi:hypothetical protein
VVKSVLKGYSGTEFAKGQTGSVLSETSLRGSPDALERIYDTSPYGSNNKYLVRASYLEM